MPGDEFNGTGSARRAVEFLQDGCGTSARFQPCGKAV
jgi:hypothetical protein